MRNARRVLVVALAMVVLIGGWLMVKPSAPTYRGKTLDQWLETFGKSFPGRYDPDAVEAIQHFGTNAIPTLIADLRTRDSRIRDREAEWLYSHPGVPIKVQTALQRRYLGYLGFCALGRDGSFAIPQLVGLLKDANESENTRSFAIRSLNVIGPAVSSAIPDLVTGLSGTNFSGGNQYELFELLSHLHGQPEIVVPVLINALTNSQTGMGTRGVVIVALGQYGEEARVAALYLPPYLTNFLDRVRIATTNTLRQIGVPAVPASVE